MTDILQKSLPYDVGAPRPMPGISPLEIADWLDIDTAYGGQMSVRTALLADHRAQVLQSEAAALPAARDLLEVVLDNLALYHTGGHHAGGFSREASPKGAVITCPDGRRVLIDRNDPLATLGHLVADDFCILEKRGDEHVLTAAVLCFPASWSLDEKFGQPLTFYSWAGEHL